MPRGADRWVVFHSKLPRRAIRDGSTGSNDQWPVGANQSGAESLDDTTIILAVRSEPREVVIERQMDHPIRPGHGPLKRAEILQ